MAVIAVLLYHGGVTWAGGGFLGVDIFFVLSGYLITALLVAEWHDAGTIGLAAFWGRRARRLLPALLVLLAAVAAYAALVVAPDELGQIRGDGLAGLFYVANWHLIFAHRSYFDQFLGPSPLTHLWSLGIEEQWYLFWPFLLGLGLRLSRGRTRALAAAAALLAGGSALAMAWLVPANGDPSRVYYGTDTRAQALLVGAFLALMLRRSPVDDGDRSSTGIQVLGLVGASALALMIVGVDGRDHWLYQGGFLLAALATVAVILSAVQPHGLVRRLLSPWPLVWVGRISYGLYLWHWLVYVALTPDRTDLSGWPLLAVRLALTLAIAVLSYRFVEMPARTWRPARARWWPLPVATAGAMAVVAGLIVTSTLGAESPLPVASAATGGTRVPPAPPASPAPPVVPGQPPPDRPAPTSGPIRVVVLGDSVAFSLGYHFKAAIAPDVKTKTAALIGCGVVRGAHIINGRVSVPNPTCEQWPARWADAVNSFDPDVSLVMVGAWEVYDRKVDGRTLRVGTPEYESYLDSEMETALGIAGSRGAPVALLNVPCYHQPNQQLGDPPSERNDPARVAWVNQVFQRIVDRHPQRLRFIDLGGFLCPGGHDAEDIDGVKVRIDGVHFTPEGAGVVWRWLAPQLVDLATHPDG
jgi:peptidoglycan/LPS O-acetylase OafA/YrhL